MTDKTYHQELTPVKTASVDEQDQLTFLRIAFTDFA